MSDTQRQRDRSKTNGDFRKRGLRLERTSLQQGGLYVKNNPIQVCAAATTRCFIDPSCQCAPVPPVCLLTYLLSFGERNNIEEVSSGAEIIFTSCKQQTNIYSRSPLSKPPPMLSTDLFPLQADAGLWGLVLSSPFMTRSQIQGNGGSRRRFPPTAMQPFVSHSSGSGPPPPFPPHHASPPQQEEQQPAAVSIRPIRLEPAVTDCIYHLI